MCEYVVATSREIKPGEHKVEVIGKRSIGIFNINGEYYAISNYCPHQGAELCRGAVSGTNLQSRVYEYVYGRDQEIIRCPWHRWEFDIKTGTSLFDDKVRIRCYQVKEEEGEVKIVFAEAADQQQ